MVKFFHAVLNGLDKVSGLGPLAARVVVGWMFFKAGEGKVENPEGIKSYLVTLDVPMPDLSAALVMWSEYVGGALLVVGLATRIASIPLAITMVVALMTAHRGDWSDFTAFVGLSQTAYLAVCLWLLFAGPGSLSVDYFIAKLGGRNKKQANDSS